MNSNIVKNTSRLLTANIIAQTVGIAIYPILTRLYSPEDFGTLNMFLTIGGIATLFATAEYQNSIMLPKSEKSSVACFHVGFIITLIVSLIFVLSIPFASKICTLLNAPQLTASYWMLPIYIFVISIWTLLNYWHTRNERFTSVSAYQITQCTTSAGLKWGLARFLGNGLIVGSVLAPVIALAANIATTFRSAIRPLLTFDKSECRQMAREYANFPKYSLPRTLINNVSGNLPVLLLAPFFGMSHIGFFGMALTLAFRPLNMISASLYQVLFQRTAEQVRRGESIKRFFSKFIRNTFFVVVPCFAILYFILPWLTNWFLGNGWDDTALYIRLMLPWLAVICIGSSIAFIPDIFQKQRTSAIIEVIYLILRACALLTGILMNSFAIAIALYCAVGFCVVGYQIVWYLRIINQYERKL
ncbi:MAG: oligosaccharide flippase family protein [Salinivirgaceae bacterium]|nr:oligosaccharide flippase family protein [Salinivirgaceae bacterium]